MEKSATTKKRKKARPKKQTISEVDALLARNGLLALDVSSTHIGGVHFIKTNVAYRFTWELDGTVDERIRRAYASMQRYLQHSHAVPLVAMEAVAYNSSRLVAQVEVQAAIKLALWSVLGNGVGIVRIAPSSIKKRFTGNYRAEKKEMIGRAEALMKVTPLTEHEADAYAVGWCVLHWTA